MVLRSNSVPDLAALLPLLACTKGKAIIKTLSINNWTQKLSLLKWAYIIFFVWNVFWQAFANLTRKCAQQHIWDSTVLLQYLKISVLVPLLNISSGAVSIKLPTFGQNNSYFFSFLLCKSFLMKWIKKFNSKYMNMSFSARNTGRMK